MGSMFCKKPQPKIQLSEEEKAILECKKCRDNIKRYIKSLENNAQYKKEKAKTLIKNKQRDRAKLYLKQSKMYEMQINNSESQLTMIEDQISQIENATIQKSAMQVLQEGNKVLKQLQSEVNVEKWQNLSDEMAELKESQDEISQFFIERGVSSEEQEKSIEDEMNKLLSDLSVSGDQLPSANNEDIQVKETNQKQLISA